MIKINYKKISIINGPAYGILEPSVIFTLETPLVKNYDWVLIDEVINGVFSATHKTNKSINNDFITQLSDRIIITSSNLQEVSGLVTRSFGRILRIKKDFEKNLNIVHLALPFSAPLRPSNADILYWPLETFKQLLNVASPQSIREEIKKSFDATNKRINQTCIQNTNTPHFIRSASHLDMPYFFINNQDIQYGWGNKQSVFRSSILDTTSSYAVTNARDKHSCAHILRLSGIPVPQHLIVNDLNNAKKAANKIGYPVVVKPADLDGGVGVSADLKNEPQLIKAFDVAIKKSSRILVEKHIEGNDYRLIVFDGELVWAVGRQPAGVEGNGLNNILELVTIANQDDRRGYTPTSTLRPIVLDPEALGLLSEQGMTVDSIPSKGLFVKLRRAANISSGGLPVVLTNQVHPENVLMIERAVKLLNLDLAGVDFISPDITEPWHSNGAVIIEITAKPQLVASSQSHLYQKILQKRVVGSGRIPIVIIDSALKDFFNVLMNSLKNKGIKAGFASKEKSLFADGSKMSTKQSVAEIVRSQLLQRDTECVICCYDLTDHLYEGLPVDRFDFFVHSLDIKSLSDARIKVAVSSILKHCTSAVYQRTSGNLLNLHHYGLPKSVSIKRLNDEDFLDELLVKLNN